IVRFVFDVAVAHPFRPAVAHESFHGISGMYPFAEAGTGAAVLVLVASQKVDWVPESSKSVPPTATLNGVEAVPLTAMPFVAFDSLLGSSHPADPLSPAETETVIPSAAACCQRAFKNPFPAVPWPASHCPKLSLITGAMLLSTMNSAEASTPSTPSVCSDSETTSLIVAPGATAPDHSTSRSASPSSPETKPGSAPFKTTCTLFAEKFKSSPNMW